SALDSSSALAWPHRTTIRPRVARLAPPRSIRNALRMTWSSPFGNTCTSQANGALCSRARLGDRSKRLGVDAAIGGEEALGVELKGLARHAGSFAPCLAAQ